MFVSSFASIDAVVGGKVPGNRDRPGVVFGVEDVAVEGRPLAELELVARATAARKDAWGGGGGRCEDRASRPAPRGAGAAAGGGAGAREACVRGCGGLGRSGRAASSPPGRLQLAPTGAHTRRKAAGRRAGL